MKYILGDKLYNVLKWLCLIAIPAVGVLYATLANIWGWPYGVAIPATLEAIGACIGILIGVSQATAKKVPQDERAPEVDTIPEVEGGIYPLTYEEAISVFEGDSDGDQ